MKQFIYSNFIPKEVKFFTSGKRYEVIERFNDYKQGTQYQVRVKDDNGVIRGPINVGWPCAYLFDIENDKVYNWETETVEDDETPTAV